MKVIPIIGASPGNSFFTDQEVGHLLKTVFSQYTEAVVFIPDVPARDTYKALGYSEGEAKRKANMKGNNLKNRFNKMAQKLGLKHGSLSFVNWKDVSQGPSYLKAEADIDTLFEANKAFREASLGTTRGVLQNHDKERNWDELEVSQAVKYLLCELAFMSVAAEYLEADRVVYVYNKEWKVYQDLIRGVFDGAERGDQQFLLVESEKNMFSPVTYGSAWERIEKTKVIRAGYFPWLNRFIELENSFSGFMYEVFEEILKREGWTVDWVEKTGYGFIPDRLESKVYDVFCSTVWPTAERIDRLEFCESLFEVPCYLWRSSESDLIKSVAVKYGDIQDAYADEYLNDTRKIYVPQFSDALSHLHYVDTGKADATFAEPDHVEAYLRDYPEGNLTKIESVMVPCTNSFVVGKEEPELLECINKNIVQMKREGFIDTLLEKYDIAFL